MRETRRMWVLALALLILPQLAGATLSSDHFNYGPDAMPLYLLSGGENWGGSWMGYDNLSPAYDPGAGLSYLHPCYSNDEWMSHEGNDPTQGGTVHQSYRGSPRAFPFELTGSVWVSVLARLGENDSFRGFVIGTDQLTFGFGITNEREPYVHFGENGQVEGAGGLSTTDTHLVIALLEFNYDESDHERISVWANPFDSDL